MIPPEERLERLARQPVLLVGTDYDGTISPIVEDPSQAVPRRDAVVALRMLAELPSTHVAIISGRSLADLAGLIEVPEGVHLVGSHGSEFDPGFASSLGREALARREALLEEIEALVEGLAGVRLEKKPASIAVHTRQVDPAAAEALLEKLRAGPARKDGVHPKEGKKVLELCVVETDKGQALEHLRHRFGATAVIFLGDDRTDEAAFATLKGPDLAVKVGDGDTEAPFRIHSPLEAARLLARLAELRTAWTQGGAAVPIEEHAVLSDQRTLALVTPGGSVCWLCLPRLDSPAVFAELLGGPGAGRFVVRAPGASECLEQRYRSGSNVLETRWPTFLVTDLLDASGGRVRQRAGRTDLLRRIEGSGEVVLEFAPRFDFGRRPVQLLPVEEGLVVDGWVEPVVLRSPGVSWEISLEGEHATARARHRLVPGEALDLELRYGTGWPGPSTVSSGDRIERTDRLWTEWSQSLSLPAVEKAAVERSALVLKALCQGPSGAIAAAGTTSLPAPIGGIRNWDYRYCWLRDAAMSAETLALLGSSEEGLALLDWITRVVEQSPQVERLHPLYTVDGRELPPEAEVSELAGYRGSRPVRVGNAASLQIQLDVFGPVIALVATLFEKDAPITPDHWRLVEAMVEAVEHRWAEPDHGIWEKRQRRRHHVHSKTMCWQAVDRAAELARLYLGRERDHWLELRQTIAEDVERQGSRGREGVFTAAYDGDDLDAAVLQVGLSGLLEPGDPRFAATVEAIEAELLEGGTLRRYRAEDGLPGTEGGFHLCTGWLIEARVALGRLDEARSLLGALLEAAGPTGLLTEQIDPETGEALGNTPQAYSHLAVIRAGLALGAAREPRHPMA